MIPSDTIQINQILYDTDSLAEFHPGGPLFVELFDGLDATEAFHTYHRRRFPHDKLKQYQTFKKSFDKPHTMDPLYEELCQEVNRILPPHKSFAPWTYYVKAIVLWFTTIAYEVWIHAQGDYYWYHMCLLGIFFALIGLNIQHDANHGAISKHFWVNRIFGLSQNWIGGSALDWMHQHVVQHHIHCNDIDHDPDITGNLLLRLNPLKPLLPHQAFQYIYLFALLGLFGITYSCTSIGNNMMLWNHTHYSHKLHSYIDFERNLTILCGLRWVFLPAFFHKHDLWITYSQVFCLFVTGGFYLAFFFVLSHNYYGVCHCDSQNKTLGTLKKQVLTSSNVGGPWLGFINGGLNYQIEHHLFPRIHHSHYPTIAPIVREFCHEKKIQYTHFPDIFANIQSCLKHLHLMGTLDPPPFYYPKQKKD